MDQIMSDTRMLRMFFKLLFEYLCRFEIRTVALVRKGLCSCKIKGVEYLGLVVLRVTRRKGLERFCPTKLSDLFRAIRPVFIVSADCFNEIPLSLGFCLDLPSLFNSGLTPRGPFRRRADSSEGIGH